MNHWLRQRSALVGTAVLASLFVLSANGQTPSADKSGEKPAADKWTIDRALTVSPSRPTVPALKYRLFPLASERKDGNAVPIYLRLNHEQNDASRKLWRETPEKWNALPLDQVPLKEAKEFLANYRRFFQQFDLGARRKSAEWNYTIDQGSVIDILLPDAQQMRGFVPMMLLRARVAIREKDYVGAARALETGFSFAQQVGEGPFLINGLVGIACASAIAEGVPDFVEQPDAPNLYWSLTALPRPLIDLRHAIEFEQRWLPLQFPDLADLDRPRATAEWDASLVRVRQEIYRLGELNQKEFAVPPGTARNDPASKSPELAAARKFLTQSAGIQADKVADMPAAQVLILALVAQYQVLNDELYKAAYLPYPQGRAVFLAAEARLKEPTDSEGGRLAHLLLSAAQKVVLAQLRLERKIAMLRVIEALRLHAAKDGELPDRLAQVTVVPVPDDPGTGKPFEYSRDGETAVLTSRIPGEPSATQGLRYKVTLRK